MNYVIIIFLFTVILSLIMHEIGHFIFAKIFKITVYEFSIGIGPKILSWSTKETIYSFRLFPIMAYVNLSSKKSRNIYKEIVDELKEDENYDLNLLNFSKKDLFNNLFIKKFSWDNLKKFNYVNQFKKYDDLYKKSSKAIYLEDINIWKNTLIIFGGIFVNILLFLFSFLILFLLDQKINLAEQINKFFVDLGNILIFKRLENTSIPLRPDTIFLVHLLLINLSLFLINVLPIPPLDGFKFFTILYEKTWKKTIPENIDLFFGIVGITFIIYLSIASIANNFI